MAVEQKEETEMEYQEYFSFAIAGEIVFGNGSVRYLPEIPFRGSLPIF